MKFCPRCGKKGITGEFCSKCHAEMIGSILEFREIEIKVCPLCMKYLLKNKWVRFDSLEVAVRKAVKENMKKRINAAITPLLPEIQFKPGRKYEFEAEIAFPHNEKYYIPVRLEMVRCRRCEKQGTSYYEGILQLRSPTKEIIEFVRRDVERNSRRGVFITKEKKVPKGIDLYITSQRYIQQLGHRLHKRFGGILKISPSIYSRDRQTSRETHRVNVYFQMLGFRQGDVVKSGSKLIKVSSTGKHVTGTNLLTGKRTSFDCKENVEALEKRKTEVVKSYPDVEVLDPETYQPVKVENRKRAEQGDEVEVVNDNGRFYIV